MIQNFDTDNTSVSVKVVGIDEVPKEMKVLADIYLTNAALFIQGVINDQLQWKELLEEQTKIGRILKDFHEAKMGDLWKSADQIVDQMLKDLKKEDE